VKDLEPKMCVPLLFAEFRRVLKPGGWLLVTVKEGNHEGYVYDLLGIRTELFFSRFTASEIQAYFAGAGFALEILEVRGPYAFEISNERIFAIGKRLRDNDIMPPL
jgi:hypothetical protein